MKIGPKGHENGIHAYLDLQGCLKRAHLEGDQDGSADADFGTHCHDWLAMYHGPFRALPLPVLDEVRPDRTCSEQELVDRYAEKFDRDALGSVLLTETRLKGAIDVKGRTYPLEGTLDLVTRFDHAQVEAFEDLQEMRLNGPGVYLHDFKTKTKHSSMTVPTLLASDQPTTYCELIRQNHPEWHSELRGVLFHLLYRYIKPSPDQFRTIRVDVPDEQAYTRLKSLIKDGVERLERDGPDHMSPSRCFDWNRLCPVFGECERHNLGAG